MIWKYSCLTPCSNFLAVFIDPTWSNKVTRAFPYLSLLHMFHPFTFFNTNTSVFHSPLLLTTWFWARHWNRDRNSNEEQSCYIFGEERYERHETEKQQKDAQDKRRALAEYKEVMAPLWLDYLELLESLDFVEYRH